MDWRHYRDKKILILGLGREGLDTLGFFLKNKIKARLAVADRVEFSRLSREAKEILTANPRIEQKFGDDYLSLLRSCDLAVKSPGIPIHLSEIEQAYALKKITSQTEIFFKQCPGKIIGITGTKGKSTTSTIIYEIIKRAGKKVFLIGNIGTPMLSYLDLADAETFFVCELSAHQLYSLEVSPWIAVLLNIYPEHLDYYYDYDEYIRAKANICLHQDRNDYLIYNSANQESAAVAMKAISQKIAFDKYDWKFSGKTALIGDFNLENAKIGAIIGRLLGVSDGDINEAIAGFKPLDNRLEFAGNFCGIDCYNDSLSTIQESAVAAIETFGGRLATLVAGGFDRGQPFGKLARAVLDSDIALLILFPETGKRIWAEIKKIAQKSGLDQRLAKIDHYFVETMDEAAKIIIVKTEKGKICVLSAASASFGGFRDYADRGEQFKTCLAAAAAK